jgi:hypothetical protein
MSKTLNPNESYTFSKFFELKLSCRNLAQEFGYSFERKQLNLPHYLGELSRLEETQKRILETQPYISLSSEASRREVLISPVILDLVYYTKAQLEIEYSIKVNQRLQGVLDYFLESNQDLLIVEAKREDLDFGMTQLVAELIALDVWLEDKSQHKLLGAVTTGKSWEFAQLQRTEKHVIQGLESYRVPEDLEELMRILVQALKT